MYVLPVWISVYVYVPCEYLIPKEARRVSNALELELELQMVVTLHVGTEKGNPVL